MKPVSTHAPANNNSPDAGHAQRIQKWIGARLRKLAGHGILGGIGSALLALPALAQATDQELDDFQFAEILPGVRSVKLLANGDAQLKLADGRIILVPAEEVHVLENGAIMIAEDIAVEIAHFAVAAEAAGASAAAGGGVGTAGAVLGGLGLAGAAAAGGGSSEENSSPADPAPTPAEPKMKSLNLAQLQGTSLNSASAKVNAPDGTTTVEITIGSVSKTVPLGPDGSWSVSLTQIEAAGLPQGEQAVTIRNLDAGGAEISIETATYSVDTVPPTLVITGFSHGAVLNAAESGTGLTITGTTDAENDQRVSMDLNGQTYSATVSGGYWEVTVPAADLTALPDGTTITVTADVKDRAGNPAAQASASFDTDFTGPSVSIDPVAGGQIDLADVSGDLTITGTTTAQDGQNVALSFNGQVYNGASSGGTWSVTVPHADLGALITGTPISVSVTTQDTAGNSVSSAPISVPVDLSGPSIVIAPLSVGTVLNAAETGSDMTISGTTGNVTDGQTVSVSVGGQTYTAPVSADSWSVTVPFSDLIALADGSAINVTADVTDLNGLIAPQATVGLYKDATPPTISIDAFSHGSVMNFFEQGTDLIITGTTTADDGQIVSVGMNGHFYTVDAYGGAWSVTVPAADLTSLTDASTFTVTADVSDVAGNPAIQASSSFDTDFTAPALSISAVSTGGVLNLSEQASGLTVTGASDAADGTNVSIQIKQSNGTVETSGTAVISGGTWTFSAAPGDLSGLQDAETYSIDASLSDTAGNTRTASAGFTTDFSAPSISVDPLPIGASLDVTEKDSDMTITGTTTAEDGQIVTVVLDGQTFSATASGGVWATSIPSSHLNSLADGGTYTVSATVADFSGNLSAAATTAFDTDFRPLLSMNAIGTNGAVSLSDAQTNGLVIGGASSGLSVGQSVNVAINSISAGTAAVATDGTWSFAVPSTAFTGLNAGDPLDFSASASVSGGPDPAPATDHVSAHLPTAYFITEVGRNGSTVTFEVYAEADRDTSSGLAFTADLNFDPSVATYDSGSENENSDFNLFLANQSGGSTISFAGAATTFTDLSQPLVTFSMTIQDPGKPIALSIASPDGGPGLWQFGTDGADTLVSTNVDDVVRGGAGNDTIDLSGTGRDLLVFEANPTANGTDTITGFTLGTAPEVADALIFSGLDASTLRGAGSGVETLAVGDVIGTNTGFVGLISTLTDLGSGTVAAAAESLAGVQAGDEIYLMATDGNDSVLVKVDYSAPDSATVQKVAQFEGLADLSSLSADNILHTDPTGATA
ncbi:MAG: Ig-like domain-containing protein [Ruegeria sp.]